MGTTDPEVPIRCTSQQLSQSHKQLSLPKPVHKFYFTSSPLLPHHLSLTLITHSKCQCANKHPLHGLLFELCVHLQFYHGVEFGHEIRSQQRLNESLIGFVCLCLLTECI